MDIFELELKDQLEACGFEKIDAITHYLLFPDGVRYIQITKEEEYYEVNFSSEKVIYQSLPALIESLEIFQETLG